jgi:hypothetical protein
MADNTYLFFDGSALIAQIRYLWREKPELRLHKFGPPAPCQCTHDPRLRHA